MPLPGGEPTGNDMAFRILSNGFCVFRRGNAEFFLKLPGEVVHGGILELRGNFGEIQVVFPNHLLAFLKLDPADIFAGGNLQILVEQSRQIAGAYVHLPGNQRHGQLLPDVGGDELLSLADDLVFRVHRIGGLQLAAGGGGGAEAAADSAGTG